MAFLDEHGQNVLKKEMQKLAAELAVDGRVRLRPGRNDIEFIENLPRLAAEAESSAEFEGLRRLSDNACMLQMCARKACLDGGARLPACGKYARISMIAERLIAGGDRAVGISEMQHALMCFDDVQVLDMSECWAFPEAVRVAVCNRAVMIARQILAAAGDHRYALEWVEGNCDDSKLRGRNPAFFEYALQLAMEMEKPELRLRLETVLSRMDTSPEACVRLAQESAALANVRLSNLMATIRAIEEADWQKIFETASITEAELRHDPDGTYPAMTAHSRAAVRARLALIARRLGVGELTVARYAVNAARGMAAGDVRRSICWWLYDDAGSRELARRLGCNGRLPWIYPDPKGYVCMSFHIVATVALAVLGGMVCGSALWGIVLVPILWDAIVRFSARIITHVMKPRAVLRMEYELLPDTARTLVAIPALLTNPERARAMCRQLETLGCLNEDENVEYVLLGDFPDSSTRVCDTDMAVLAAARDEISRMNAASGRNKYHYLHRERAYWEKDNIYRGSERKRGALMALCRVATGRSRGEFKAEGAAENSIFGRFRYLVTMDADTCMLHGTVNELVGAISHPLNRVRFDGGMRRGFSIMQPLVELDAAECRNRFVELFAGHGGVSTYSGMISDMFHDLTGTGSYCGKGVIDMPAFLELVEGRLEDGRILSHDFIEGALGGAGHINDVAFFDGYPENYQKWLSRMARWTRGDWQLIPDILRGDISMLARFRMVSNLMSSLKEISLLLLFVVALWTGNPYAFAVGILFALLLPIGMRIAGDRLAFVRGSFELAVLPATAYVRADAIIRALWRTFVSSEKLLEWVTSADAAGDALMIRITGRAAAILLVPGLFSAYWFAPAVALGALFMIAPGLANDLASTKMGSDESLDDKATEEIRKLARDTWRYFERYTDASGNYLPPDNVQLDPDMGIARRTSPTNIGMYMLACVCARELGFIGTEEMRLRLSDTLETLERMEKWRGHIYNWYDIDNLSVLEPRYVSSVDSGNLAAALLTCAEACGDDALAERLRIFAINMDMAALYDRERKLFHIGVDVAHDKFSNSYYDLLASESRILSFVAIMLGQVPVEHWKHLGRPVSGDTLMSWSGTMFEYFMPALLMPSAPVSLLGSSYRGVVKAQMKYAAERRRPWGISESGYHTFDADMNYQYRAFGLRALSMGGNRSQDVVAPYGACLALMVRPAAAYDNIRSIQDSGWSGECGLYEAVDFVRREPRPVKSWMAHHQGMALCAMCNTLTDNALQRYFIGIPQARAIRLLLDERAVSRMKLKKVEIAGADERAHRRAYNTRVGRSSTMIADVMILGGADACALVAARGNVVYSRRGVYASRFTGDLLRRRDSMETWLVDTAGNVRCINSDASRCVFDTGSAVFSGMFSGVRYEMRLAVCPEDGMLVKHISVENTAEGAVDISIIDGFETALMNMGEMRAHPAFHRLFCSADMSCDNALITTRKMRENGAVSPAIIHVSTCNISGRETDWMRLVGRDGVLNTDFMGHSGAHTDPCSALKVNLSMHGGDKAELAFAVGLCSADETRHRADRYGELQSVVRALRLAEAYVHSAAEFVGFDHNKRVIAERASALLVDPRLMRRNDAAAGVASEIVHPDIPRLCLLLDRDTGLHVLRETVRMHEYCRSMGFIYQLVIICDSGNGYDRPLRDAVYEIIGASHLRDMSYVRGGVTIYDAALLTAEKIVAVKRSACLNLDSSAGYWDQLRRRLMLLQYGRTEAPLAMPGGNVAAGHAGDMKYGRIGPDGYEIDVYPGNIPPAPWSNIVMADKLGMLITERGGGFVWHGNSRLRRVTCFDNDPAAEGWSSMLYVIDERGMYIRALPGPIPDRHYRVCHGLAGSTFECCANDVHVVTTVSGDERNDTICFEVKVTNLTKEVEDYRIVGFMDWLMGADGADAACTCTWKCGEVLLASGTLDVTAFMICSAVEVEGCPDRCAFLGHGGVMCPDGMNKAGDGGNALAGKISVEPGKTGAVRFSVGCRDDIDSAIIAAEQAKRYAAGEALSASEQRWSEINDRFAVVTGDERLDWLVNGFMLKQTIDGRIRARTGFYQAGGAYGFRDQLQDMLAILPYDPDMVRNHILTCARHQFRDGDVMHWWHPPMTGVRTRISDDMLFLPFVTAHYVLHTGDDEILDYEEPYLKNIEIPDGLEDIYAEMELSGETDMLKEHCMRAFRRACRRGQHGLLLMGTGDWNDGMNRVGSRGRGESVWLSMFFVVCARLFAGLLEDGMDRAWLMKSADELMESIQKYGWDGEWYLRAYDDDGEKLGSCECDECMIDLIAQSWSVLSDCPGSRARSAMDAAWKKLYDSEYRILRLLTPPFTGKEFDPGYIAAYPPGVRENGGQYTHAACWYLIALAKQGDAVRARELLDALAPLNHALTTREADVYRTEPYVMAADIYGEYPYTGRGGWTWYTGAAGWYLCAVRYLLGYERRGDRVRMHALAGIWEKPSITVRFGNTRYTLVSDATADYTVVDGVEMPDDYVTMIDDGGEHICVFAMRKSNKRMQ